MPKALSSIIAELEDNPSINSIRVETWRSIEMAYVTYVMGSGATCTMLFKGPCLAKLTKLDPHTLSWKERQAITLSLIDKYGVKQMKVAKILGVSQSTVSLDMGLVGTGLKRAGTRSRNKVVNQNV